MVLLTADKSLERHDPWIILFTIRSMSCPSAWGRGRATISASNEGRSVGKNATTGDCRVAVNRVLSYVLGEGGADSCFVKLQITVEK